MISKQQFDMCVTALNNGGEFITHRGYCAIRNAASETPRQVSDEVFSAVLRYCGGRENFKVTDTQTPFGIETTWKLIHSVYDGELPTFARTDIDGKLTKTPEFKQKVDSVKKAIKSAFGCAPYERKNNAKYTLLKFWADSEVDAGKLENITSMFSGVSAEQLTRREFNVTIYPDTEPKFEFTGDLMEALNRAHELDEGRGKQVKKSDVIKYLRDHEEVKLSREDFDYIVDDLWNAICREIRDGADYETIEDVNMGELMDASDNPTHDICMRLLGFMDDEDDNNEDEEQSDGTTFVWDGKSEIPTAATTVVIADGVTRIPDWTFRKCRMTNVSIPSTVTHIGVGAFSGCENLDNIVIPNSVTTIQRVAFEGCKSLTSITIPNCVTTIDANIVNWCTNLRTITIPDSIEEITGFPTNEMRPSSDAFTICCSKGSYAHTYALENNIPVKLI